MQIPASVLSSSKDMEETQNSFKPWNPLWS